MQCTRSWLHLCWVWAVIMSLFACQTPASPQPAQIAAAESVTPTAASTQPPAEALAPLSQEAALLPGFRSDLLELAPAPHYILQVRIDPLAGSFQGSLQLQYTNQEDVPLEQLYLRLYPNDGASYGKGWLEVSHLSLDGHPLTPASSQPGSIVQIDLPAPLPPDGQAVLEMDFKGQVGRDFDGEEYGAYGIYNLSEQVLVLTGWYPLLAVYDASGWNLDRVNPVGDAVYADMATYQVQVTFPAAYTLAATGVQVESQTAGDDSITTWISGPAREFALVASPRFSVVSQAVGGVKLNVYFLDEAQAEGQAVLEVAVESLQAFNRHFGAYPYTEFDVVQVPLRNAGGVEFPGIVFIEGERFLSYDNPVAVTTVAHEVSHQWWYNLVGNDVVEEPWLDEALASYSSILYWEEVGGSGAYAAVLQDFQSRYDQAVEKGLAGQVAQGMVYYGLPEHAASYGAMVYTKGALFFHALRQQIGDEAFFTALQQYYQQQRYQVATGDDLKSAFENAAGRDLEDFYQTWLAGDG